MCENCKNQNVCPYTEEYKILCEPLVDAINNDFESKIFTMELKCNLENKELPYNVDNTLVNSVELDKELERILGELN